MVKKVRAEAYRTGPVKRRSKNEMKELLEATLRALEDEPGAMTVRHLCYVGLSKLTTER